MTDKEIIKALECCIKDDYDKGCMECPVHCYKGCDFHLAKFALDLINRQKAKIDRQKDHIELLEIEKQSLKEAIDKAKATASGVIKRQDAEIKNLTAQRDKAVKDFEEFDRTAFDIPFACKHCVHSIEDGRACLWKEEHEDKEEACLGRHFEYKEMAGED